MTPAAGDSRSTIPLLKICLFGCYLKRGHSSRRLEGEAQRNIELRWLTGAAGARLQADR